MFGISGIGFLFACVTLMIKQSNALINLIQPIIFLLCGIFFPLTALPIALQQFSMLLPLTLGFQAVQQITLSNATLSMVMPLLISTIILGTVLALIGVFGLRVAMKWARRRGVIGAF